MADTPRPGAVTAVAILNLLIGSVVLLGCLCSTALLGGMGYLVAVSPQPGPGEPDLRAVAAAGDSAYPLFKYAFITDTILGIAVAVMLIVSGIGLLRMKRWGRKLALATGIAVIAFELLYQGYAAVQGNAAMIKFMDEFQQETEKAAKARPGAAAPPPAMPTLDPAIMALGNIASLIAECVYPLILIWVMMKRDVRLAFGEASPAPREDLDRGWGESAG